MGRNSDAFGPGRPRLADVVVAAVFTVVAIVNLVGETVYGGSELVWDARGTWWAVMTTSVAVALAWRRRRPLVAVVVALVAVSTTDPPRGSLLVLWLGVIWCVIVAGAVLHGSWTTLVAAVLAAGSIAVVGATVGWGVAVAAASSPSSAATGRRSGAPSSRSGSAWPASCTTWSRTT